jgi:hypothetical protein
MHLSPGQVKKHVFLRIGLVLLPVFRIRNVFQLVSMLFANTGLLGRHNLDQFSISIIRISNLVHPEAPPRLPRLQLFPSVGILTKSS